ncbi:MAG: hypothetical protein IKQ37_04410 [Bacteroidaceae bacterium]|nr:hypothetical protein [Bacteroidaceae bacterium]
MSLQAKLASIFPSAGGVRGGFCIMLLALIVSCSVKKNTSATRAYHALTAHYNTLYNGQVAFLEGSEAQYKGHKDNFNEILPMYIVTNKATAGMGKSNFETAITKCEKAIKVHSIKKRPITKGNQKRTAKEKEFLARKEFNPYLYRAWLMMADAQFRKGEFFEAASTYNYMLRLYSTQPNIASIARARLARCYVALDWPYDAEDLLNKMRRDSITRKGLKDYDNTKAGYYVLTHQYREAIPHLQSTIKSTRGKLPKARLRFLLAQLYHETGRDTLAYKTLSRVIRANPPYEIAFNARIMQTEVMHKGKFRQMIARLKRMARSDKNKDYLDKVYYAMGNIYLSNEDTTHCIYAWEKGLKESTKNGPDKATLLLHLSQLYWEQENYIEAARTYKLCVSALDKEHYEYKETERRSKILSELEPHLSAIKLQDSLQVLAQSPEEVYLAAIDRVIAELRKKEKEEAKKAAANGTLNPNAPNNGLATNNTAAAANKPAIATDLSSFGSQKQGDWYFYNPTTVKNGIQEFQKRWGMRRNEDYWRISNKQALIANMSEEEAKMFEGYDEAAADSLYGAANSAAADSLAAADKARKDSLANDPHEREYYLKQIPFTEEQMAESNRLLGDALYNAGIQEQEQLENFPLAERTMVRFLNDFPEHEGTDNVFYHLFLLYGRLGDIESAEEYRGYLLEDYPDVKLAELLGNPNYEMIARDGKHIEDSIYVEAYAAYQNEQYDKVEENYQFSTDNFPQGTHRARMMFIRAMSSLYGGERDTFMVTLRDVIQQFPKEEVTELAQAIVKGIDEGRLLMDDRYDVSSIWSRRTRALSNDSTEAAPELKDNRYTDFCFVLAYPTGSLDENMLVYEMAHYNFTNYMVRNFDIEIQADAGLTMMIIKGFLAYDEVHAYAQKLYADDHMRTRLEGIRTLLISDDNLKMIGKEFSFDDYKEFYDEHFAPLDIPEDLKIDIPENLEILDPDELDKKEQEEEEKSAQEAEDDDDFPFGF